MGQTPADQIGQPSMWRRDSRPDGSSQPRIDLRLGASDNATTSRSSSSEGKAPTRIFDAALRSRLKDASSGHLRR
jgi:hypothetical protein